jgi:rod shape determining protein RodA
MLAVCGLGWLILFSASGQDLGPGSDAIRQAGYIGAGLFFAVALSIIDYDVLARLVRPLYALNVGLLLLVVFVGHSAKGAQRWISLGPLGTFQPSEPAKLLLIITLSYALARRARSAPGKAADGGALIRALVHVFIPFVLILIQPDLGTAMVLIAVMLAMLFVVGMSPVYLAAIMTAGLGVAAVGLKEYQRNRLLVFLYPEADPMGKGYSLIQSRTAIGSGQLWGKGLFHGPMVGHHFVPEHTTDFIFANVGEELGLLGTVGFVLLFSILIGGCVWVALRARDLFGTLLCTGVAAMLAFHVFINVGMTIGLMPIAGVPLPMVSYGGSAMMTDLAAIGLVAGVYRHSRREYVGEWS